MNHCNLPESWRITGRDDVMDCCMKNESNPYYKDSRRYDYGKRHDVFFNYNDDKLKNTSWHPRNPKILSIRGPLKKYETVEMPRYHPDRTHCFPDAANRTCNRERHDYDAPTERDYGCEKSYPSKYNRRENKKFKESELVSVKSYLQNCLMQRLSVDWTEEDDLHLTDSIYMYLAKLKGPNQVGDILDEISHGKKMDPILVSYVGLLKKIYIKRGYCEESPFENYSPSTSPPVSPTNYSSPEISRCSGLHNYMPGKGKYPLPHAYCSGGADNYNGPYTCSSPVTGKYLESYNYDSGENTKFNNSSNFSADGRASSAPYRRAYVCTTCSSEACNCRSPSRYENISQQVSAGAYNNQGYGRNGKSETQKCMYTGDDRIFQRGGEEQRPYCGRIRHEDDDGDIKLYIHPSRTLSYNDGLDSDDESTIRFHASRHPSELSIPRRRGVYYRRYM